MTDVDMTHREEKLDEAIEESFPASDAPANTVVTGTHVAVGSADARQVRVHDNISGHRFEIVVDGQTAYLRYERGPKVITLVHTEVPFILRGRGLANVLAKAAIDAAHHDGLSVVALCPFVRAYLRKHPQLSSASVAATV